MNFPKNNFAIYSIKGRGTKNMQEIFSFNLVIYLSSSIIIYFIKDLRRVYQQIEPLHGHTAYVQIHACRHNKYICTANVLK